MTLKKLSHQLLVTVLFFLISATLGYSQTKMQKDGKYKAKGHHAHEHYHHAESRKKHHKAEFGQHSRMENTSFAKKKNKRKNK